MVQDPLLFLGHALERQGEKQSCVLLIAVKRHLRRPSPSLGKISLNPLRESVAATMFTDARMEHAR